MKFIVKGVPKLIGFVILLLIVIAGFGQAVLQLWNHLMPDIFGLPALTFWQAVGLMALSWILFGGLRGFLAGPGYRSQWKHRFAEKWEQLTPEQREKLREGMKSACGGSRVMERDV